MSAKRIIEEALVALDHARGLLVDSQPINVGSQLRWADTMREIDAVIVKCDAAIAGPPIDWDANRPDRPASVEREEQ